MNSTERLILLGIIRDLEGNVDCPEGSLDRLRLLANPEGLSELWLLESGVIGPATCPSRNAVGATRTIRELLKLTLGQAHTLVSESPSNLGVQDPGNPYVKQLLSEHTCEWRKV
jgi:hypothetical protein